MCVYILLLKLQDTLKLKTRFKLQYFLNFSLVNSKSSPNDGFYIDFVILTEVYIIPWSEALFLGLSRHR